jgi:Carboxypeptidase regulatory-like domain/TonB dependent receptor-like, beta-barrel
LGSCRRFGWAVAAFVLLGPVVPRAVADPGGGLVGWVESTRGVPVAGAVVSIFGKGISGGALVTLSDSRGQFVLPFLPAGSYTLRAVGTGHVPSPAQHVTVLPNRDAVYTVSLTPVDEKANAADDDAEDNPASTSLREWLWLMRHKRRSVLETEGNEAAVPAADKAKAHQLDTTPRLADLGPLAGSVELVAVSTSGDVLPAGQGLPASMGALHLEGRLADGVRWSLGGLMAENEGRVVRTAAEFVLEPGGGHEIQAGAGYGASVSDAGGPFASGVVEPDRTSGAAFVTDHWRLGERFAATAGARYTYVGFLPDSHHADAVLQIELHGDRRTLVRGSLTTRTLAPGGDLLTLSTLAASPAITWARLEDGLRPSSTLRYEMDVDRRVGDGHVGAQVFDEHTRDVMLTTFDGMTPVIRNAGNAEARGFGVTVGHRFLGVVDGSVTYTFGHARRSSALPFSAAPVAGPEETQFHDVVARVETFIDGTDTRVAALYRLNAATEDNSAIAGTSHGATTAARFDVQLTQGLPFLQPLTRADWEILLAVRNMFYEASQVGFLDELAVQDPPTRVVGGISVRF